MTNPKPTHKQEEAAEDAAEAKRKHDAEVAFDAKKAADKAAGHETLEEKLDDAKDKLLGE